MTTRIVAAAIRQDGLTFTIPAPARHHDIISAMARSEIDIPIVGEQGFIDSSGNFVDRCIARQIAEAADQLIPRKDSGVPFVAQHPQLFSEDVW